MKDKGGLENSQRWETGLMTTSSHSRWMNKEKHKQRQIQKLLVIAKILSTLSIHWVYRLVHFEYRLQIWPKSPVGKKPLVFVQSSVSWQLPACRPIVCWFVSIVMSCCFQFLLFSQIEYHCCPNAKKEMRASFATHGKEETERILIFLFSSSMHFRKQYLTAKIQADNTSKVQRYLFATLENRIFKTLKFMRIHFLCKAFHNHFLNISGKSLISRHFPNSDSLCVTNLTNLKM